MTGLSKITDKIINEAQIDARRVLAEADKKCAEILAEYKKEAEKSFRAVEVEAEKEAKKIVARAKTEAGIIGKNLITDAKTRLADKVFEDAKEEILSFSDEKYLEFLINLLISLLKEVYADETAGKIEVLLSENDRDKHGAALLDGVSRQLIGKIDAKFIEGVSLSRAAADISGGVLLATRDFDVNGSVECLLEKIRPEVEAGIRKLLF